MGVIQHNDRRITLGPHNEVGRSRRCVVPLQNKAASAHHAIIAWRDGRWQVRDLGSRNGTQVDGAPVDVGGYVALDQGMALTFGTESESWRLIDDAAPGARAHCAERGETITADGELLALPNDEAPEACLFLDDAGVWWVEHDDEPRHGQDHQELVLPSGRWVVQLPPPESTSVATTRAVDTDVRVLEQMECRFRVSLDEEHVELALADALGTVQLGARAHHELLLALARARLKDREGGLPEAECGWVYVDQVSDMVGIDPQHLTVTVFRARKQVAEEGILNAAALIERRPRPRQMRLGMQRVVVESF